MDGRLLDKNLLPLGYEIQEMPYYKGDGNYSILELERICKEFKEYVHQQQLIKQKLMEIIEYKNI